MADSGRSSESQSPRSVKARLEARAAQQGTRNLEQSDLRRVYHEKHAAAEQRAEQHLQAKSARAASHANAVIHKGAVATSQKDHEAAVRHEQLVARLEHAREARETAMFERSEQAAHHVQRVKQISERQSDHAAAMASLQTMQLQERLDGAERRRMTAGSPFAPASPVKRVDKAPQPAQAEQGPSKSIGTDGTASNSMDSTPSIFLSREAQHAETAPQSNSQRHQPSADLLARISPPQMRGTPLFHLSQAREEAAAANRSRLIGSVVSAAKATNSGAASTHALHATAQAKRSAAARADFNARMAAAAARRREALLASADTARRHVAHVQATVTGNRKAATKLQRWWRYAQQQHAEHSSSDGDASAPMSPDSAMLRVHFSPLQSPARAHVSPALQGSGEAAALRSLGAAMPELDIGDAAHAPSTPPRAATAASPVEGGGSIQASPNSRAANAALRAMAITSDATERIQATLSVRRVFQSKGAQRASRVLQRVLSGEYAVGHPDGMAPRGTSPPSESATGNALSLAVSAPVHKAPREFAAASPSYPGFDECAAVLQERSAVSAAMHFTKLVRHAYAKLAPVVGSAPSDGDGSSEGGQGGGQPADSHAYSGKASDPASDASLRPAIAQSPRTLLAALLLAWFPSDILGSPTPGGGATTAERKDVERRLTEAARVMLEALHQLCEAVQSMAPARHDTPVPTPTHPVSGGGQHDTSGEYAALLERFAATHDAEHVETLLRCTLLQPRDITALPRRAVLLLHRVLAFNACHVEFMDQYMVWKLGDAARMAQSLVQPYSQALRQSWHYQRKLQEQEQEHGKAAIARPAAQSTAHFTSTASSANGAASSSTLQAPDWAKLPRPVDDGGASHLMGALLPPVRLETSGGDQPATDVSSLHGTTVLFLFPMTGRPGESLPPGWDDIPGARGCTPQACAFRDLHRDLKAAGATHVMGMSTQSVQEQVEAKDRLHLPYPLLSDRVLRFASALSLPTFTAGGAVRLKRMTLVIMNGRIVHVRYPVFPPSDDATHVLQWLREHAAQVAAAAEAPTAQASPAQRPLGGGSMAYHQLHSAVQAQLATMDGQLRRLLGAKGATKWVQHITQRTSEQWALEHNGQQPPANPAITAAESAAGVSGRPPRPPQQRPSAKPTGEPAAAAASTGGEGGSAVAGATPSAHADADTDEEDDQQLPRSTRGGPSMALVKQVMSNAALAHAVMLDPDFALPSPPAPPGCSMQWVDGAEQDTQENAQALRQLVRVEQPVVQAAGDAGAAADDAAVSAAARHMAMVMRLARGGTDNGQSFITEGVRTNWRWGTAQAQQDMLSSGSSKLPSTKSQYASYWGDVLSLAIAEDGETGAGVITEAISSVLTAIQSLVPHRTDLHEEMQRSFDLQTTRRMLAARAMGHEDWWRLISQLVARLADLEAPARAAEGAQWLQRIQRAFQAVDGVAASADQHNTASATALVAPAPRAMLPVVLAWMHWRVALVQSDISNFQLSTLRPYLLRGGRGAEYERKQWAAAAQAGTASVDAVNAWVRQEALQMIRTVDVPRSASQEDALHLRIAATRQLAGDSDISRVCLLRDGMLSLLQLPYPIAQLAALASEPDVIQARGSIPVSRLQTLTSADDVDQQHDEKILFPGTLSLDAKTLTNGQNVVQRTALVACLTMIFDQFVSQLPTAPGTRASGLSIPDMQNEVLAWLEDDHIRLPDLREAALHLVQRRAAGLARLQVDESQHPQHVKRLFALVDSAVSYEHALYALCMKRVVVALRHAVTQALLQQMPSGGAMSKASDNVFWASYISEPPAVVASCVPAPCAAQLHGLASRLASIARHNNAVHSALYQQALQQLTGGAVRHHTRRVDGSARASSSDTDSDEL